MSLIRKFGDLLLNRHSLNPADNFVCSNLICLIQYPWTPSGQGDLPVELKLLCCYLAHIVFLFFCFFFVDFLLYFSDPLCLVVITDIFFGDILQENVSFVEPHHCLCLVLQTFQSLCWLFWYGLFCWYWLIQFGNNALFHFEQNFFPCFNSSVTKYSPLFLTLCLCFNPAFLKGTF